MQHLRLYFRIRATLQTILTMSNPTTKNGDDDFDDDHPLDAQLCKAPSLGSGSNRSGDGLDEDDSDGSGR